MEFPLPEPAELIERYLAGPAALRQAVDGLSAAEIDALPIAGTWSIRQVVCHLADAEILYADRMKRIVAEHEPSLLKADPASFLTALAVDQRPISEELQLIEAIRAHLGPILASLAPAQFDRRGIHSTDGPMTLRTVLERAVDHIPHHVAFVLRKRTALLAARTRGQ